MTYKKKKNLKDLNLPAPVHEETGKAKKKLTMNDLMALYPSMTLQEIRQMLGLEDRRYPKKIHSLSDL